MSYREPPIDIISIAQQASPNVALHVAELAYGERPFEVTGDDPGDVQLRTVPELWHKENILNVAVQRFPAGWPGRGSCCAAGSCAAA